METNCFQKMLDVICEWIFVLCIALPGKPWALPLQQHLSLAEKLISIYMRPQIVQVCGTMI